MIKILLVDDHDLVRTGIRLILDSEKAFDVVAEANSGEQAIKICRSHDLDIVLMDMNMPGMGGLEATRKILRHDPDAKVIFLSMYKENPIPAKVMQVGAWGFVTKDAEPKEMVKAILQVHAGQKYIAPDVAQQIALGKLDAGGVDPFKHLSEREMQIMMMLTRGSKVPDIAIQLNISAKTVNTYRYRMFEKLGVTGDVELTHLALRHKIISPDQL
ncbi:UvrY/SirA/GacA family response regulator transcription factor [Aliiglaciecola sp. CAU 1673]|uniref:UvrY/SirA/GacA family response regulator transcription factor n=1 Tax=Aliiglaciecola sp. CAU 1673 TaxID=3032595 RepID=UPI0023DAA220|nr:UvrY/SirA/GacA family response regulator transcription factor [Aliiglaciecola sp. CAU 1673]MDF2178746.1 UvrY/SirA/GacA family response regulator transcription factor [Aliiglaciecola sp. CAU 1673]